MNTKTALTHLNRSPHPLPARYYLADASSGLVTACGVSLEGVEAFIAGKAPTWPPGPVARPGATRG